MSPEMAVTCDDGRSMWPHAARCLASLAPRLAPLDSSPRCEGTLA
jgi:hypothetical protein